MSKSILTFEVEYLFLGLHQRFHASNHKKVKTAQEVLQINALQRLTES